MADPEICCYDEWEDLGEEFEIKSVGTFEGNNGKNESTFVKLLAEDELISIKNIGEVSITENSDENHSKQETAEIFYYDDWKSLAGEFETKSKNIFVKNNRKNKIIYAKLLAEDELIPSENIGEVSRSEILDENDSKKETTEMQYYDDWEDLAEEFEGNFEENNNKNKIVFVKLLSEDGMNHSANIGEVSITEIFEESHSNQENYAEATGESSLEIISQQNANVILYLKSVLAGEDHERTVLEHLCRKFRSNTKWIMDYSKIGGQKSKITLTELTDLKQGKVLKNRSALMFGLSSTDISYFALGFSIGFSIGLSIGYWIGIRFLPTYAIFEFDLDSVVY